MRGVVRKTGLYSFTDDLSCVDSKVLLVFTFVATE